MAGSGRSFTPISARAEDEPFELPEWLRAAATDEPADESAPAEAPRRHVLARAARPTPQGAADLVAQSTPAVERLAPMLRRFHAPRRVWMRRGAIAGALLGSCAVLVSGIILTGGTAVLGGASSASSAAPEGAKSAGALVAMPTAAAPAPVTSEPLVSIPVPSLRAPSGPQDPPPAADPSPVVPSLAPDPQPSDPPVEPEPSDPPVEPEPTDPPIDPVPPVDELPIDPFDGFPF